MKTIKLKKPIPYKAYEDFQKKIRLKRRELILICEHYPAITEGVKSKDYSLKTHPIELQKIGIDYLKVKRGGDRTAHEIGQIVIYPHIDLRQRGIHIHTLFESLLEISRIAIFKVWGIETENHSQASGLYLIHSNQKLLSIGLSFKSFFTSYGIALNYTNNLDTFSYIIPCALKNIEMTSIKKIKGKKACNRKKKEQFIFAWLREFHKKYP